MCTSKTCPKCNSQNTFKSDLKEHYYMCGDCNHKFTSHGITKDEFLSKLNQSIEFLKENIDLYENVSVEINLK